MALDVVDAVLQVPVPLGQVHLQQVAQQVLKIAAEVGGKANLEKGEKRTSHYSYCIGTTYYKQEQTTYVPRPA